MQCNSKWIQLQESTALWRRNSHTQWHGSLEHITDPQSASSSIPRAAFLCYLQLSCNGDLICHLTIKHKVVENPCYFWHKLDVTFDILLSRIREDVVSQYRIAVARAPIACAPHFFNNENTSWFHQSSEWILDFFLLFYQLQAVINNYPHFFNNEKS